MLSLFSSVGICCILRYGSSNTSTVEQQVCPRFFSGPSKFGEMRRCERKMLKCNAELVDIVFRLMFETFWVAPYDLRRDFRCWSISNVMRAMRRCGWVKSTSPRPPGRRYTNWERPSQRSTGPSGRSPKRGCFRPWSVPRRRNWSDASGMRCLRPAPPGLRRLFRTIRNSCGMPAPPGPCDRRSQGFCHAPSPSLGITALRDFLGGSAKAGKTGAGLKRNGPRLGNEFPAGPDAF